MTGQTSTATIRVFIPGERFNDILQSIKRNVVEEKDVFNQRTQEDSKVFTFNSYHHAYDFAWEMQNLSLYMYERQSAKTILLRCYKEFCPSTLALSAASKEKPANVVWKHKHTHDTCTTSHYETYDESRIIISFIVEHLKVMNNERLVEEFILRHPDIQVPTFNKTLSRLVTVYEHMYTQYIAHSNIDEDIEDIREKYCNNQIFASKDLSIHRFNKKNSKQAGSWCVIVQVATEIKKFGTLQVGASSIGIDHASNEKGSLVLVSFVSRNMITGGAAPIVFLITNDYSSDILKFFFNEVKYYNSSLVSQNFMIEYGMLSTTNIIKEVLPQSRIQLCMESVYHAIARKVKGSGLVIPISDLGRIFYEFVYANSDAESETIWATIETTYETYPELWDLLSQLKKVRRYWMSMQSSGFINSSNNLVAEFEGRLKKNIIPNRRVDYIIKTLAEEVELLKQESKEVWQGTRERILSSVEIQNRNDAITLAREEGFIENNVVSHNKSQECFHVTVPNEIGCIVRCSEKGFACSCKSSCHWCLHIFFVVIKKEREGNWKMQFNEGTFTQQYTPTEGFKQREYIDLPPLMSNNIEYDPINHDPLIENHLAVDDDHPYISDDSNIHGETIESFSSPDINQDNREETNSQCQINKLLNESNTLKRSIDEISNGMQKNDVLQQVVRCRLELQNINKRICLPQDLERQCSNNGRSITPRSGETMFQGSKRQSYKRWRSSLPRLVKAILHQLGKGFSRSRRQDQPTLGD
ncbi:uncharacterized protein J8A68_003091 [[Candida] subhashii]|uniref:SWIM-type domain-containing protein n=1 Tax=[Candida] subhashii TaxID=561895 RepID=A0A8J5QJM0_9ASCO|nr:uncharacterized protein J8A68_003091 [[Candida] subhashii]KAG7663343.1 hypothetical protein J8A68_003091 [[Candida] subhashii]